jgi:hypothetical protein
MLVNLKLNQVKSDKTPTQKYRLYLSDLNDIDQDNWPEAANATISTNVLAATKSWNYIDGKVNSVKPNVEPGESPITGKLTIPIMIEGLSKAVLAWLYENQGKRVIACWERCADNQKFIGGSPCSGGLEIMLSNLGEIEGGTLGLVINLVGGDCPDPLYFYDVEGVDFPVAADPVEGGE